MSEYIRGWRQLKAIWIFFECLFKGNWKCAKREIHILTGFAKPYSVRFHPLFWESCREMGMGEEDVDELRRKYEPDYKGRDYYQRT